MIATKTNLEITEYREKFFLGLSLRQLACFAAAAVLAIATCFVFLHWLRMDMQVVSYIVMVEVLPFLGLGFIHRDGYPFEKLVKIYWAWHSENAAVPIRPYKESRNGEKMPEEILLLVEDYIDGKLHVFDKDWPELPFAHREHIGCTVDYVSGRNRYMGYLISLGIYSFKGVKVGLDCANGSSWNIAKSVFDALGADTYVINAQPNGTNINNNAGSTHI